MFRLRGRSAAEIVRGARVYPVSAEYLRSWQRAGLRGWLLRRRYWTDVIPSGSEDAGLAATIGADDSFVFPTWKARPGWIRIDYGGRPRSLPASGGLDKVEWPASPSTATKLLKFRARVMRYTQASDKP